MPFSKVVPDGPITCFDTDCATKFSEKDKYVIGPSGTTFENGTNKLSYTTGEVVVGAMTAEDGSLYLGNGYYPSLTLETLTAETPAIQLEIKVFPNPVTEVIYITHPTELFFEISITDISGKQILGVKDLRKNIGIQIKESIHLTKYLKANFQTTQLTD